MNARNITIANNKADPPITFGSFISESAEAATPTVGSPNRIAKLRGIGDLGSTFCAVQRVGGCSVAGQGQREGIRLVAVGGVLGIAEVPSDQCKFDERLVLVRGAEHARAGLTRAAAIP
jgi:hypothetical protein